MKLTFILAFVAGLHAQSTQVPSTSISYPAVQFQAVQILTPGGIVIAQLHPSIVLDLSGPVPVLRAIAAPRTERKTEVFSPGTTYTAVTLSLPPDAVREIRVYRNGLLMAASIDYTRVDRVITFTAAQGTAAEDIVQVSYGPA